MDTFIKYSFEDFKSRYGISIPENWENIIKVIGPKTSGPWIAGGFLRRLFCALPLDSDIDIFCFDENQRVETIGALNAAFSGIETAEGEYNSSMLIPFSEDHKSIKVQVIKIFSLTADAVIDGFDFTICQWAFDGENLIVGPYTIYDTLRKRLAIHKITFPISTARRILKYANQGYTVCAGTLEDMFKWVVADPALLNQKAEYID